MSLKGRLSRLGPNAPLSAEERRARQRLQEPSVAPTSAPAPPPSPPVQVLHELRARMAAMLERSPPPPRPTHEQSIAELPFVRVDTEYGPLTQRLCVLAPSHHVGRIPVESARTVSAALLSLLALDPRISDVSPERALYLDTETTGLGGAGTLAFLVGLAWFNTDGRLVLEQLLLASPAEELALIEHVRARLDACSVIVSFNGKSFDLPLLQARAVMSACPRLPEKPHLDLLHVGRRLHKARLGSCRLIHLETEVLGWERGADDIAGADIAPLYGHFLRTGDGEVLRAVVEHNAWDVVTMAALVGLYGEPVGLLHPADLLGVAETARRHRAYDQARAFADASLERGVGHSALYVRAQIEKARGDKARALLDFELLSQEVDDPAVRLELVKLYEHHAKDFETALRVLGQGVLEDEAAIEKRRLRLEQKTEKKPPQPRAPHARRRR